MGRPKALTEKQCLWCGQGFHPHTGKQSYCSRPCWKSAMDAIPEEAKLARRREMRLAWKKNNAEKLRLQWSTPEARARRQTWRDANPERVQLYHARYLQNHPDTVRESKANHASSELCQQTREKRRRKFWQTPSLRMKMVVERAFIRAIRSDLEFDQCLKQILMDNPPMVCACCGVDFNYSGDPQKTRQRTSPSIDRVDNTKGYVVGNVQIICWGCNADKSHLTVERMEQFIAYIKRHIGVAPCGVKQA